MKKRRQSSGGLPMWVWIIGGAWLLLGRQAAPAPLGLQQPILWWANKASTGILSYAPGLLPPDGLSPVESAWRPASEWEILIGSST